LKGGRKVISECERQLGEPETIGEDETGDDGEQGIDRKERAKNSGGGQVEQPQARSCGGSKRERKGRLPS